MLRREHSNRHRPGIPELRGCAAEWGKPLACSPQRTAQLLAPGAGGCLVHLHLHIFHHDAPRLPPGARHNHKVENPQAHGQITSKTKCFGNGDLGLCGRQCPKENVVKPAPPSPVCFSPSVPVVLPPPPQSQSPPLVQEVRLLSPLCN